MSSHGKLRILDSEAFNLDTKKQASIDTGTDVSRRRKEGQGVSQPLLADCFIDASAKKVG